MNPHAASVRNCCLSPTRASVTIDAPPDHATREMPVEEASASQLVSRWFIYTLQLKAKEHASLHATLERARSREPNHADAWACLSNLYCWEYVHRLNPLDRPMERAVEAAWRAVTINPACQLGWQQLAEANFFARDR